MAEDGLVSPFRGHDSTDSPGAVVHGDTFEYLCDLSIKGLPVKSMGQI